METTVDEAARRQARLRSPARLGASCREGWHDQRGKPRVPVDGRGFLCHRLPIEVRDRSAVGLGFRCRQAPRVGSAVTFRYSLSGREYSGRGVVSWCRLVEVRQVDRDAIPTYAAGITCGTVGIGLDDGIQVEPGHS